MPLEPGSKLGRFEIVSPLRSDAFGDSYKASDPERKRTVTLRILSPTTSDNVTQRLEQDSRVATSLNHPHIASVYEVGSHEGTAYMVTEYVEGETLAQRLQRGSLDLEEGLKIGMALADALDKAHRKGLVHRNLCPASILMTTDGVKLADFGLAAPASSIGMVVPDSMSPTRTSPTAMATPTAAMPYQAPEQVAGKDSDNRADLFALGAILYEMAAGKPAFEGKTQALLIAAITSIDPEPLSTVQPLAPPALDFIIKRCLAKTPQKRLQTAWDLLCQLRWIAEGGGDSPIWTSASPQKKRDRIYRIALGAAALLVLILAPLAYMGHESAPAKLEARYVLTDLGFMRPPGGSTVYISPNGHWLITSRIVDDPGLDALAMDSVTKQSLLNGMAVYTPFWKPDSTEFAFWAEGKLKRASVSGGPATNIAEVPAPFGAGSWSSSGVIVYGSAGTLYRVLDVGGESTPVTKVDTAGGETEHVGPTFLPDGRHFLYLAVASPPENSAIYVGSLDSTDRTKLFNAQSRPIYAEPGYVLFNRGDVVYAYSFDAKSLTVKGEPVRVADGVPMLGFAPGTPLSDGLRGTAAFAVSQTGIFSYRLNGTPTRGNAVTATGDGNAKSLIWIGGPRSGTVVGPEGTYAGISLSPDGKRIAVHRHEGGGGDIWLYDPDQGERMQRWTTNVSQENSMPVWSPDGKRIAFASKRNGKWGIYVKSADKTGTEESIVESPLPVAPMSWVKDQLVYWIEDPKTRGDIWVVTMDGEHKASPILATAAEELFPQLSPDAKWIAYMAPDAMNMMQIWVNSFPKGQQSAWQITNDGGAWPRWRGDGKVLDLYFVNNGVVTVTLRVVGDAIQSSVPRPLFPLSNPNLLNSTHYSVAGSYHRYAVTPDGQSFLFAQPPTAPPIARGGVAQRGRGLAPIADGVLANVEGRGGSINPPNEIAIIHNWPRLMKP